MINPNFEKAKEKIIGIDRQRLGIGTLSEKTVHAVLKNYYEPDEDHQEIPIDRYVADIYRDGEILEIQTRQFNKLRGKLECFLKEYPVTVIHPIAYEKWLCWIDEETGQISNKRKSPVKGNEYMIFPELYKIKSFLKNPNLRLKIVLMNMEEYRLLNGWSRDRKKGSTRYDRIPTEIIRETDITCFQDYMQFVPETLEEFTIKDFAKEAHISQGLAEEVVPILYHMGVLTRVGKKGNAFIYHMLEY